MGSVTGAVKEKLGLFFAYGLQGRRKTESRMKMTRLPNVSKLETMIY